MRKTLAVLVLMISSLLLLQAPAWAQPEPDHHLYRMEKGPSQRANAQGLSRTRYDLLTNCPSGAKFTSSAWTPSTVNGTYVASEIYQGVKRHKYKAFGNLEGNQTATLKNTKVECTMAFTGRSVAHQLLLGMGLLLVGAMFLVLTGPPDVFRRRRPRRASPS